MTYQFHNRLIHNQTRFAEVNTETVRFENSDGTIVIPSIAMSPISLLPMEESSETIITRIIYMAWGVNKALMLSLFPPKQGYKITTADGRVYTLVNRITAYGSSGLCYLNTTADESRILLNSQKVVN